MLIKYNNIRHFIYFLGTLIYSDYVLYIIICKQNALIIQSFFLFLFWLHIKCLTNREYRHSDAKKRHPTKSRWH